MTENNLYTRLLALISDKGETSLSLARAFNMQQPNLTQ